MSTRLSKHFKNRRLDLGLRPGEIAKQMGYQSIVGAANKICRFEISGYISPELLAKLATVLDIDRATIDRLFEEERRANLEAWNEWANVPIRPHVVIKLIPCVFATNEIPDDLLGDREAMEQFAADLARRARKRVWLVLSRRLSIMFDEQGQRFQRKEASSERANVPHTRLKNSGKEFIFDSELRPRSNSDQKPNEEQP
jgi:hypothetical protein